MKPIIRRYVGDLFFGQRWYIAVTACSLLFLFRFFMPGVGVLPFIFLAALAFAFLFEYTALFIGKGSVFASRTHAERLSNGDENEIVLHLQNFYKFPISAEIVDEVPAQFQMRDLVFDVTLAAGVARKLTYHLRPVKRGEYAFGSTNIFAAGFLQLLKRRFVLPTAKTVPVYPSYIQMRRFQIMAIHERLTESGVKKLRKLGHSMEFEQVMEYVPGDDQRTVNWKATARKGQLMVNHYTDEKSQQIYCIIDKGRLMKMPFEGLSLLDYAVNTSLVLSSIALIKQDKAGLITFSDKMGKFLPADKRATQMQQILDTLYRQKSRYLESDFERLYVNVRRRINQRSLLILFTNFESLTGLQRQLPYLRKLSSMHVLMVVFFENTELLELTTKNPGDLQGVYHKTIAEKFAYEKKLIAKELRKYGIISILTAPKMMTVNTINKYLEMKSRGTI